MKLEEQDYVLTELVDLTNKTDLRVSLTVLVDGGAVCGALVSNRTWFSTISETLKAASRAAGDQVGLHSLYERWHEDVNTLRLDDEKAQTVLQEAGLPARYLEILGEASQTGYLHLVNARFLNGGSPTSGVPLAFRIRISEVSGWSFGEVSPT